MKFLSFRKVPYGIEFYAVELTIPTNGAAITRLGGLINVSLAELKSLGLTSDNGEYQWVVMSFHGSHPQSQVFRVRGD